MLPFSIAFLFLSSIIVYCRNQYDSNAQFFLTVWPAICLIFKLTEGVQYRVFAPVLDSACTKHPRILDSTGVIAPVPSSTW